MLKNYRQQISEQNFSITNALAEINYAKLFSTLLLAFTMASLISHVAWAEESGTLDKIFQGGMRLFKSSKAIILILGGFGIIGFAYNAIFGKVKWGWLSMLCLGLFVLASTGAIFEYVQDGVNGDVTGSGDDVFGSLAHRTGIFANGFKKIALCFAGFGVIMFTFMAIFGKINFKHLGYIFISLFMLSGVGMLIGSISGKNESGDLTAYSSFKSFDTSEKAAPDSGAERSTSLGSESE